VLVIVANLMAGLGARGGVQVLFANAMYERTYSQYLRFRVVGFVLCDGETQQSVISEEANLVNCFFPGILI